MEAVQAHCVTISTILSVPIIHTQASQNAWVISVLVPMVKFLHDDPAERRIEELAG
jgi:hypothetical protein